MTTKSNTAKPAGSMRGSAKRLALLALFSALIILMAFTPFLGYIPLGFTRATIIHIPVILGALLLGPTDGAFLGFVFGLTSLINNTVNPTATSFVFSPFYSLGEFEGGWASLLICMLPRILTGVVPYYVYRLIRKLNRKLRANAVLPLAAAGVSGALTNTLLVMNMIYRFFGKQYAAASGEAADAAYLFILSIIGINGVPEAIVAGILMTLLGKVLLNEKVRANIGV